MVEDDPMQPSISAEDGTKTIEIENFMNNPLVSYNENNLPYVTSVAINVPVKQVIKGVYYRDRSLGDKDIEQSDEGKLIPFVDFTDYNQSETEELAAGNEALIITPNNQGNEVVRIRNPAGGTNKIMHFAKNCKVAIMTALEIADYFVNGVSWLYDTYGKVSMAIPKLLLPLKLIAASEGPEDLWIGRYSEYQGSELPGDEINQFNSVTLPNWLYICDLD